MATLDISGTDDVPALASWLRRSASLWPEKLALEASGLRWTYAQLMTRVQALSQELQRQGLQAGDRVGIAATRSAETVVAILAAVDAGVAYVPMDLAYPPQRLRAMLEDAAPRLVLGEPAALQELERPIGTFARLGQPAPPAAAPFAALPKLGYVLFTSGSTGKPKGVAMGAPALARLLAFHAAHPRLGKPARTLQFAPLSFDVHFQEIFSSVACGGTLVLLPEAVRRDGEQLRAAIARLGIQRLFLPFAALHMLAEASPAGDSLALLDVVSAGEQLQITPAIQRLFQGLPAARLHNHYGPTESHVVLVHELPERLALWPAIVPIGRPLSHVQVAVRQVQGQVVGDADAGELLLGGDCLAHGYLGAPALTAERFLQDVPGLPGRWYVTGDLVRRDAAGDFIYVGRADQQLKIDGFRVEPGEIEVALLAHPSVREAVVTAPELPGIGRQLVAHLVLRADTEVASLGQAPGAELRTELRKHLAGRLPEHMVPLHFMALAALPLTPSGKIDRGQLLCPSACAPAQGASAGSEPRDVVRVLWQELLGLETLANDANLFGLGARSLLVLRFLSRLKSHGFAGLAIADVYDRPTVQGITDALRQQPAVPKSAAGKRPGTAGVAIVGMALRTPGAGDVEAFWKQLLEGREGIRHLSAAEIDSSVPAALRERPNFVAARGMLEDADRFDAEFFGMSAREATVLDPQQRLLLELSWNALEHAAIDPWHSGSRVGVFAGTANNTYINALRQEHPALEQQFGEFATMLASEKDYVATRIAHRLNLKGPAVSVHTACSTSLVAVAQAWQALADGQCDLALAGGASVIVPQASGYLHVEGGMESADGHCRPFDAAASGTVFSSGGAMVVLKRLEDALADGDTVFAVIRGVGINNDGGDKASFTAPSAQGQAAAIRMALDHAQVSARSIGYVEAHGTATALGDPIEVAALCRAWHADTDDTQFCGLGSVKGNLGHLVAAAGVVGLIKASLALQREQIPRTLHFKQPHPQLALESTPFRVVAETTPWPRTAQPRRAAVSSFGVGGTNAHLVLEEAPALEPQAKPSATPAETSPAGLPPLSPLCLLALSARSPQALRQRAADLAVHLQQHPDFSLAEVATTLMRGRAALPQRASVLVASLPQALSALHSLPAAVQALGAPRLVFLFPGQGSQHAGMARSLYAHIPAFREALDRCLGIVKGISGVDYAPWLVEADHDNAIASASLADTRHAQPALFSVCFASASWLASVGVNADAMIGHSVGELVAACLAGVMSLEDALTVVHARGQAMAEQPGGSMLAVHAGAAQVEPLLPPGVEIAGVNAPMLTVVSGRHDAIATLLVALEAHAIGSSALHVSHAFHSAMMDAALPAVQAALGRVALQAPCSTVYSCVSGAPLTQEDATNPAYWARQARAPVQFSRALASELAHADSVFVEVGPGQALSALLRQHRSAEGAVARHVALLGSAQKPGDAAAHALQALGQLWCHGVQVSWPVPRGAKRAQLPTYPFADDRYWFERKAVMSQPESTAPTPPTPQTSVPTSRLPRLEHQLQRIFADVSGLLPDEIARTASLLDQGMDSLSLTQATLEIDHAFGIKLRFRRLLEDLDTIDKLARFLDAELAPDEVTPAPSATPAPVLATQIEAAGGTSFLQQTIAHQLQLMAQQLQLLGAQPQAVVAPVPAVAPEPAAAANASLVEKPFGASPRLTLQAQQDFSPAQRTWLNDFIGHCDAKFGKSKAFSQKHRQRMADPRVVTGFNPLWKELVYPLVVERSQGTRMWDLDGNELIDLLASFGANFLGYQPPDLVLAITEQLQRGIELGPQHPLSAEVADLISEFTGMERVAFCNTGSEAVVGALRMARTVTGRKTVAIFSNSYHGIVDEVIVRGSKQLRSLAAAPGIPPSAVEHMLVLDYASEDSLRVLRERAHELAAIMIEPIQNKVPSLQPRAFVQSLREICDAAGCALIFDECVTGFRVAPGGAQEFYGIRGDLACYGKIIGGGLPLSAIAGSPRWMDALDGGPWQYGDASYPEAGVTYFAGTFVRHPLALAAAKASLLHIQRAGPALYRDINARAQALVTRLNAAFAANGAPVKAVHCTSLWRLAWDDGQKNISLFYWLVRFHGLHLYEQFGHFLNEAMGDADTDRIFSVFTAALDELMALGFITPRGPRPEDESHDLREGPLTPGQTERWLAGNFDPAARRALNESLCIGLAGDVDLTALDLALRDVLNRHPAFRICFDTEQPVQRISECQPPDFGLVDLRAQADADEALDRHCRESSGQVFALDRAPLAALSVLRLSDGRTAVHLVASHLIFDGWASSVFNADLAQAYRARCAGSPPGWAEAASPLAFGREEQARFGGKNGQADLAFWQARMSNPPLPLCLGDLSPAGPRHYGADTARARLDGPVLQRLRAQARGAGATLFQLLLTAVSMLLQRRSASSDFVVSIPFASQSLKRRAPLVADGVLDLPLRLQCSPGDTAASLLQRVRGELLDALDHPLMTQGTLARALGLRSRGDRPPLTGVYFNLNPAVDLSAYAPLTATLHEGRKAGLLGEIFFNFYETPGELSLDLHYSTEFLSAGRASELVSELMAQCALLAQSLDEPLAQSGPAADPRLLCWNDTTVPLDSQARVEIWVDAQARRTPDEIALVAPGVRMSYGALASRARRFAQVLRARGVGPGTRVGVCLGRGPELVPALLGVLKAGAAYVPLDPLFPRERLLYMAHDAELSLVITQAEYTHLSGLGREQQLLVDTDKALIDQALDAELQGLAPALPDAPAYVIYTSGSTGKPKGVVLPQRAVCNFLASVGQAPGMTARDRLLAVTTLSFDIAVLELFLPLTCGARVVLAQRDDMVDGQALARLLSSEGINLMQATPTTWHLLLDAGWQAPSGFRALCGGEALSPALAARLLAAGVELWNLYGPTETTVWSTLARITDASTPIVIGRPMHNTRVWVMDESGQSAAIGAPGELCIGGLGLATGYFKRPELTADRFVADPFNASPDARLYRTGDLGRWREDGQLEHLGRLDFQVKIRGYRIELGEIEACLEAQSGVARGVALPVEDLPGQFRLLAYAVAQPGSVLDPSALRAALRGPLPDYMLPQQVILLNQMPLLPNGKIDRKALPIPSAAVAAGASTAQPPRNPLERQLATAMASVLKLPDVGVDEDFFSLGGHSLLAAQLIGRINRELGLQLAFRSLFESPTVETLAAAVTLARSADAAPPRAAITPLAERSSAPLTVMQERINFVERMLPGRLIYHAPSGHRLRGPMDLRAFQRSFAEVVRRQEAFRTAIVASGEGYVQQVQASDKLDLASLLPLTDLSHLPETAQEAALQEDMNRQTALLFTLDRAPLIRAQLYKLAADHHALFLMAHHIVWDGWSFDIFYAEMAAHYGAFLQDQPSPLPPLPINYGDFAAWHDSWMQSEEISQQTAYWKRQLGAPRPRPESHLDKPRPRVSTGHSATAYLDIDAALVGRLKALAQHTGSTTSIVLLAAYAALMSQWMDETIPTIGLPVRGRPAPELEGVMGFFNNMLPLRLNVNLSLPLIDWVRQVRHQVTDAIANQDVPFERISQALNLPPGAIYQALFNFQDVRARPTRWGDLQHERIHVSLDGASEDMSLWLVEADSGVSGGFKYDPDLFLPESIAALRDRFARLIAEGVQDPERSLATLLAPGPAELAALAAWDKVRPAVTGSEVARRVEQHWSARHSDVALRHQARCWTGGDLCQALRRVASAVNDHVQGERSLVILASSDPFYQLVGLLAALQADASLCLVAESDPRLHNIWDMPDLALMIGAGVHAAHWPSNVPQLVLPAVPLEIQAAQPSSQAVLVVTDARRLTAMLTGLEADAKARPADTWLCSIEPARPLFCILQAGASLASGAAVAFDALAAQGEALDLDHLFEHAGLTIVQAPAAAWNLWLAGPRRARAGGATAVMDNALAAPILARALLEAGLSVINVTREAELGLPLVAGAIRSARDAAILGSPLQSGLLKLSDAAGLPTAPGLAGELMALSQGSDGRWQATGLRARWRWDGQLEHLAGLQDVSAEVQPAVSPAQAQAKLAMTPAERDMQGLWGELLGRSDIGLDDNFFNLGGYSLLAMGLLAKVEVRFGKKIQPASLLEAPTIRGLSALVEQKKGRNALLKLRSGSGGHSVFFIHDVDGEVLLYRNLAMRLHERHTVYALRPHGDDEFPILHTRMTEMVEHYVQKIQSAQPHGPYVLAGLCAGGEIAFEVACRLQAQGERIATLALFESTHSSTSVRPRLLSQRRLDRLRQALDAGKDRGALIRVSHAAATVVLKAVSAIRYDLGSRISQARMNGEFGKLRASLDKGERPGARARRLTVRQIVSYAQSTAQSRSRLAGNVLLLRAKQGDGTQGDQPFIELYADPLFGWKAGVLGEVLAVDVEGGHSSMLQEPFVASTHAVLQAYIDAALRPRDVSLAL